MVDMLPLEVTQRVVRFLEKEKPGQAEADSTACYVQNRVLVVKPHNKTLYELFHGRTPTLGFMTPFGCPVTILNTIDYLGKFDGKADEGSGLDWLFDIDEPTRTMNYKPIIVGIQSNGFADPKSSYDDGSKPLSDDEKKADEDPRKESECKDQEKEDNVNITNNVNTTSNVNTVSSTVNAAGTNKVTAVGGKISIELLFDQKMHALEDDSIFDFSSDDEDNGAVADMNNLDTKIQVSPIATTRIHKDHSLDQVIWRFTINYTNKKDVKEFRGTCVLDFPNGKRAIGFKRGFRNQKDERGIVIRNKARLVAQGYTQEKGINYDEVFAPVARIKAIRLFLAYASFKYFVVYQMDIKSDFLYGKIEEEVGKIGKTLFIKRHKGDILLVQVYVDDIIFGSTKKELCIKFERLMHEKFQMNFMGELTFFLGLHVKQKKDGIFISQDKYVAEILKKFRFIEVKTANTSMETQKPMLKDEDGEGVDVYMYRFLIFMM
nr:retrovirus-related Pol polyprotein from transposon TNT 1-94 [Tanacetum cinerariifolium]